MENMKKHKVQHSLHPIYFLDNFHIKEKSERTNPFCLNVIVEMISNDHLFLGVNSFKIQTHLRIRLKQRNRLALLPLIYSNV